MSSKCFSHFTTNNVTNTSCNINRESESILNESHHLQERLLVSVFKLSVKISLTFSADK